MNSYVVAAAAGYLLGSIPFGYMLVRVFYGTDVRSGGSGNIGATNVARTSRWLGIATLLLDAGKGFLAVVLVRTWFPGPRVLLIMTMGAFFAILGHLFPVWLKFRGGKGVATSLGSFALIAPKSVLFAVGVFVIVVAAFRYVSLGSVSSAASFPLVALGQSEIAGPAQIALLATASALVIWKHRENIARLLAGTESKLWAKRA